MRVFQTFEQIFAFFIVRPELAKTSRQQWMNKWKIPVIIYILAVASTTLLIYLFHDAKTSQEYSETVYGLATLLTGTFGLSMYKLKSEQIFKMNDDFQSAIEMREYFSDFILFSFELR